MLAEPSPRPTLTVVLWRTVTATPVFLIVKSSCRKFNHSSITEVINCGAKNWIHVIKMLYHTAAVYKHQLYTHIPMQVVNLGMFRQITDLGKRRLSDYRERTDYLLTNPHYFIFSPCSEKSQCARQVSPPALISQHCPRWYLEWASRQTPQSQRAVCISSTCKTARASGDIHTGGKFKGVGRMPTSGH